MASTGGGLIWLWPANRTGMLQFTGASPHDQYMIHDAWVNTVTRFTLYVVGTGIDRFGLLVVDVGCWMWCICRLKGALDDQSPVSSSVNSSLGTWLRACVLISMTWREEVVPTGRWHFPFCRLETVPAVDARSWSWYHADCVETGRSFSSSSRGESGGSRLPGPDLIS
jgi:hypothetical protein